MNAERAQELARACGLITEAIEILQEAMDDEEEDLEDLRDDDEEDHDDEIDETEENIETLQTVIDHLTDAEFELPDAYSGFGIE